MKALILVGGYGTRLRPLTINFPKSVFPFANRPMVEYQIEALVKVGVSQVVIAINYQAHYIKDELRELEDRYKIKITYSEEKEALGTAGPLKLAQTVLTQDNPSSLFFVLNSDIICDYPLEDLVAFQKTHNGEGSIVLATVKDPRRFGVIVAKEDGQVDSFVEKPQVFISNKINAGIYLLKTSVLQRIPERFCMIEKEVFPQMAQEGKLYSLALKNDFWFDIGRPEDYLLGQGAFLKYFGITNPNTEGNVLVHSSSKIEAGCKIGPNVVVGPNCHVQTGCRISNCAIIGRTKVGQNSFLNNSIISWKCKIGNWVRVEGLTCIAEEVEIKDEVRVTECMILSHKAVAANCEKQILM